MKYHFKIHREKKGYWAESLELEGCRSQADNMQELLKNLSEALNLYLSEPQTSELIFPAAKKLIKTKKIIQVQVEPSIAFALQMKQIRQNRNLTQKDMMDLLNIKHLSNYQRLENPKKANPELKTLVELKSHLPELNVNLIFN